MKKWLLTQLIILCTQIAGMSQPPGTTPAFPGAEGFGRFTTGGRGGQVLHVTHLKDSGPGSLRSAIMAEGPRTVVFDVSGIIALESPLVIKNGDITIAGQSAPGDGICLKNYSLRIDASNVIIRYIRSRMGDERSYEGDAMFGIGMFHFIENVIIDHCTLSWSTDECGSFYDIQNLTVQWTVFSESLRASVHEKGAHGFGGIWGGHQASFHHNLLAHHDSRNPRMNGSRYSGKPEKEHVDFRNNVIYNWGGNSGYAGEGGRFNFVNNYYKPGPATRAIVKTRIFAPNPDKGNNNNKKGVYGTFYVTGNHMSGSSEVTEDNWKGITPVGGLSHSDIRSLTAFDWGQVTTHSAEVAFKKVLSYAGASLVRDSHDQRIVREVANGTTTYTGSLTDDPRPGLIDTQEDAGGWPTYKSLPVPADGDQDGMPDAWEEANGLDKKDQTDGVGYGLSSVYTNLEVYLNGLVATITKEQLSEGSANYSDPPHAAVGKE